MTVLNIVEFINPMPMDGRFYGVPGEPAIAIQDVTISTVDASDPFSDQTKMVFLNAEGACRFLIGPPGTEAADNATSQLLLAGQSVYRGVRSGDVVSVIAHS